MWTFNSLTQFETFFYIRWWQADGNPGYRAVCASILNIRMSKTDLYNPCCAPGSRMGSGLATFWDGQLPDGVEGLCIFIYAFANRVSYDLEK